MLCKPCHQLFRPVDFSTLHDDQISVAYSQRDAFPACPKITASADAGCRFCAALVKSIRRRWRPLQLDQNLTHSRETLVIGPMARFFAQSYVQDVPEGTENGLYLLELDARIDGCDRVATLRFEMFANSGMLHYVIFDTKKTKTGCSDGSNITLVVTNVSSIRYCSPFHPQACATYDR